MKLFVTFKDHKNFTQLDRSPPGSGSELNARPRLAAAHVATPDWHIAIREAPASVDNIVPLLSEVRIQRALSKCRTSPVCDATSDSQTKATMKRVS